MTLKEIREKKSEDLVLLLGELAEKVFQIRCISERLTPQKGVEVHAIRKDVARIKTVLQERSLSQAIKEELSQLEEALKQQSKNARLQKRKKELQRKARELSRVEVR